MAYSGYYPLPIVAGGTNHTINPSFLVYLNANEIGVTGDGQPASPIWNAVAFDTTNSFDLLNSQYIAPVAGNYVFNINLTATGISSANTSGFVSFSLGSSSARFIVWESNPFAIAISGLLVINGTAIIPLDINESLAIEFNIDGSGGSTVDLSGQALIDGGQTTFSGYLLI